MTTIIANNNYIVLYTEDKIVAYNIKSNTFTDVKIPPLELPPNLTENQQNALKNEKRTIQSTAFSKYDKYFAVCTLNKQLVIYNNKFQVIKNLNVQRAVSKIRFTSSGNIVIADKTGDVYLCRLEDEKSEREQLLGHLSMLLDVLVTDNEKYIITCDRDEKIRVSQFPGSYNIVSYCLGHEEFVLNIEFYNQDILISSSGDGTIRFWDFLQGRQLKVLNTNDYIKDKSLIDKFSEYMDSETVEVSSLPITNMKVKKFNDRTIIIVSLHKFEGLQVFEVSNELDTKLIQIIELNNILSFDVSDKLYVLTNSGIKVYEFQDKFCSLEDANLSKFYDSCKDIIRNTNAETISLLYKRKYDNVQEYKERKKLRIESRKK